MALPLVIDEFLAAFDQMPAGISIIDQALNIRFWNRPFLEIMAVPPEIMREPMPLEALVRFNARRGDFGEGELEELVRQRLELARRFEPHRFNRTLPDGRIVEVTGQVLYDRDRQPTGFATIYRDVTLEKTYERELETRNAQLATALEEIRNTHLDLLQREKITSVGHLAAGIAHEINNPLGFISSNVNALEHDLDRLFRLAASVEARLDSLPAPLAAELRTELRQLDWPTLRSENHEIFEETRGGLTRIRSIVAQLARFAHDVPDIWQFEQIPVIVERALAVARTAMGDRITVTTHYAEVPELRCLPVELTHAVLTLLMNSAQAIPGCGKVEIRVGLLGTDVAIDVSDDGSGIEPDDLPHIFNPFFTTKPVGAGPGLGLSACLHIVQKHGGRITVDSQPGDGATFRLLLPVRREAEAGSADEPVLAAPATE